jgi:hypothetical protein
MTWLKSPSGPETSILSRLSGLPSNLSSRVCKDGGSCEKLITGYGSRKNVR